MEQIKTSVKDSENYFQIVLKDGKIYPKLYKDLQRGVKAVGIRNIEKIIEVRKELVNTKFTEIDSLTDTPENEL
jgi:hypothetical protein